MCMHIHIYIYICCFCFVHMHPLPFRLNAHCRRLLPRHCLQLQQACMQLLCWELLCLQLLCRLATPLQLLCLQLQASFSNSFACSSPEPMSKRLGGPTTGNQCKKPRWPNAMWLNARCNWLSFSADDRRQIGNINALCLEPPKIGFRSVQPIEHRIKCSRLIQALDLVAARLHIDDPLTMQFDCSMQFETPSAWDKLPEIMIVRVHGDFPFQNWCRRE